MTRRFAGLAVVMIALAAGPAGAQTPSPHGGMTDAMMDMAPIVHMLEMVDLSAAQKQQIHPLLMQAAAQTANQGEQIHAAELKLHTALLADVPDEQAIADAKAELNAMHAAALDRHVALAEQIAQLLTPDQRQHLLNLHR